MNRFAIVAIVMLFVFVSLGISDNLVYLREVGGVLKDTKTEEYFTIYTEQDEIDVVFSFPEDADFWVVVRGQSGEILGDFSLVEGNIVNLTGGGQFSLIIYSQEGVGEWYARVEEP